MSKIGIRGILLYGETKLEKLLNLVFFVSLLITLASVVSVFIAKPPPKFYSVPFFCFAYTIGVLHLRSKYIGGEDEEYKEFIKEAREAGIKEDEIKKYVEAKKEWDIYKLWVVLVVLLSLVVAFVFWLIP